MNETNTEVKKLTRRDFIRTFGVLAEALLLASCGGSNPDSPDKAGDNIGVDTPPPTPESLASQISELVKDFGPVLEGAEVAEIVQSLTEEELKVFKVATGGQLNEGFKIVMADGSEELFGVFRGITTQDGSQVIVPMRIWHLENEAGEGDSQVKELTLNRFSPEDQSKTTEDNLLARGYSAITTIVINEPSEDPDAAATAVAGIAAEIAASSETPSTLVFVYHRGENGETQVMGGYVWDEKSHGYVKADMGSLGGVPGHLSLISASNQETGGMLEMPDDATRYLQGKNWNYRYTETGLIIFDTTEGEDNTVLLFNSAASPDVWLSLEEWLIDNPIDAMVNGYGMSEEMAKAKLAGVESVKAEVITKYVDGILITNHETGEDLFYFDQNTEMWVDVDRFEGTSDIENITFTITEEELRSKEMTAWLYYLASKLEFDPTNINNAHAQVYFSGGVVYIGYSADSAPNFSQEGSAPFDRNPGALMKLDVPNEGAFTEHIFMPIIYFDVESQKLVPVKGFIRGGKNNINEMLTRWRDEMNVSLIITQMPADFPYPSSITAKTEKLLGETDENNMSFKDRILTFFNDGSTPRPGASHLSDPNVVVEMLTSGGNENK